MTDEGRRRPILLAYDGSAPAARAIARAGALLGGRKALVVHTWVGVSDFLLRTDPDRLAGPMAEAAEELDAGTEAEAQETAAVGADLARDAGFDPEPLALREPHNPWRTLLEAATEHDADLVALGARGQSGLSSAILGSVSMGLVHHAERPVLVVPEDEVDSGEGLLLVCYDGSENAKEAIEQAGRLFTGREAVVLYTWAPWRSRVSYVPGMAGSLAGMANELDADAEPKAAARAEEGATLAASAGLAATARSQSSDSAWRAIVQVANELETSAIIVGVRGLTGITAALGSVSHAVLHQAKRAVLIVPPGEGS